MIDASNSFCQWHRSPASQRIWVLSQRELAAFGLVTLHRPSNVDSSATLAGLFVLSSPWPIGCLNLPGSSENPREAPAVGH